MVKMTKRGLAEMQEDSESISEGQRGDASIIVILCTYIYKTTYI